jgi:hypothetical protein
VTQHFCSQFEKDNLLNVITWIGVVELTFASAWHGSLDRSMSNCSREQQKKTTEEEENRRRRRKHHRHWRFT